MVNLCQAFFLCAKSTKVEVRSVNGRGYEVRLTLFHVFDLLANMVCGTNGWHLGGDRLCPPCEAIIRN